MSEYAMFVAFGGAVITALTGAVGYLFKAFEASRAMIQKELIDCQEDRTRLWQEIAGIKKQVKKNTEDIEH
jgi:lipid II:glycine glycyltransferase (peptidoglycan interpeptide bridge formation enzyme)